jgi:hypothetical protein
VEAVAVDVHFAPLAVDPSARPGRIAGLDRDAARILPADVGIVGLVMGCLGKAGGTRTPNTMFR